MLKGVNFGSDGPHITHLLFADDSIVFLEASLESLHALKEVLLAYESAIGTEGQSPKVFNFLWTRLQPKWKGATETNSWCQ
jgi:hypothetical protein